MLRTKEKELVQIIPEIIGSSIEITEAKHKPYIGIKGKVLDETKNTFLIMKEQSSKIIRVAKKNIKFKFATKKGKSIEVEGASLLHYPEDRLKRKWLKKLAI